MSEAASAPDEPRLSGYHVRLLVFLSVATFFEGYDFLALAQLLPTIRREFDLSPSAGGALVAVVNVGTIVAYALVRQADRWGRRRVMSVTIAGYTVGSALTAAAVGPVSFAAAQLVARVFLIAEWAVAMVYAAEEFPAARRGTLLGVVQGCSGLGAVVCAATVPMLLKTPLGWRTVYLIGAVPLVLLAVARRSLRETARFSAQAAEAPGEAVSIWRTDSARRLALVAVAWFGAYLCSNTAVTFWKEFALAERGWTEGEVGRAVSVAALVAMPLSFGAGKLLDLIGRRGGAAIVCLTMAIGCAASYTLRSPAALTVALVATVFGASAILAVFNTYTAELFPTARRAAAFGWANNLLGRVGFVGAPLAVGVAAERWGWGPSVAATAVGPVLALAVVLLGLPETRGRELEDTASV